MHDSSYMYMYCNCKSHNRVLCRVTTSVKHVIQLLYKVLVYEGTYIDTLFNQNMQLSVFCCSYPVSELFFIFFERTLQYSGCKKHGVHSSETSCFVFGTSMSLCLLVQRVTKHLGHNLSHFSGKRYNTLVLSVLSNLPKGQRKRKQKTRLASRQVHPNLFLLPWYCSCTIA